eukprot:TRINITY_DN7118_c0_g1_i1.p2 TRINITY_DN7118_c0_g1~~TRINITY_DN7118_c0_g1_i1.p2  ORF type:complete len:286 (+),score=22.88 TRINITY_DN7118_c0_g1_i1:71-859(+)
MSKIDDSPLRGNPEDEIVLCGLPRLGDVACSASPFVEKLEAFLVMSGLPYSAKSSLPTSAPKNRLPFIQHGKNTVGDTTFIIRYLQNTYGDRIKIQPPSDPMLAGVAHAVERMIEGELIFGIAYYRILVPEGLKRMRETFIRDAVSLPLRPIAVRVFKKRVNDLLQKQGLGQHSEKDMFTMLDNSLKAISNILGNNKYIVGDSPVPQDACLFSFLDQVINDGFESKLKTLVQKYPNLVEYNTRLRATYFPNGPTESFKKLDK